MIKGQKIIKYVFLVSVVFLGCSEHYKNTKVVVFPDKIEINNAFSLDTIGPKGWDTVYILKPYYSLESFKTIRIPDEIKRDIDTKLITENYCVLVFTKNNNVLYYSPVNRSISDFSTVDSYKYPSDHIYMLDKHRKVIDYKRRSD